jgi:hypothetical protein
MTRYFLLAVLVFLLYWMLKGTLRRFLAPPKRRPRRTMTDSRSAQRVPPDTTKNVGIDYSKVKDADFRDLR